ncbi:Hsp20/alpha crystallin family protein [Bacteroidota bacterium]
MRLENYHIPRKLLLTTDFMNTVNGGMAMVTFNLKKDKDGYITLLVVPGVSLDNVKIEISDNRIYIYYLMEFGEKGGHTGIRRLPYTLGIMDIPYDVNINGISARSEDDKLKIVLPYNELAGGFRREISIDKS